MGESKLPEEKRIWMKDFPLVPGDVVIMEIEGKTRLGRVVEVYSRNPDPGQTISLKSKVDFEEHVGAMHESVRLSRYTSMWAVIVFVVRTDLVTKYFHTYELTEMLENNSLAKIDPEKVFDQYLNIAIH
jgi:hypothetical protein